MYRWFILKDYKNEASIKQTAEIQKNTNTGKDIKNFHIIIYGL